MDLNHNCQYFNQKLPWQFEHDGFGSLGITDAKLVMISPDKYFEDVVNLVGTHTELDVYPHDSNILEDMKKHLNQELSNPNNTNNWKWDIPYILIDSSKEQRSTQDGRHRMAVMSEMKIKQVPCLYLYKTKKRKKNLQDHELLLDSPDGYFLTEMISENNGRDAKGYLVCSNVVAARTGIQQYFGKEMFSNKKYLNDVFYLERPAEEVFSEETMASFNGAAFTDGHPKGGRVTSKNSKELSKGMVVNPRKADYLDDEGNELLLVDVIITDEDLANDVEKGKKQVSAGYAWDFDVIDLGARRLRIKNIRANHLALVGRGRAKSAMIKDSLDEEEIKEIILDTKIKEISLNGGEDMAEKLKKYKFSLTDTNEIIEATGFESEEEAEEAIKQYYEALEKN